MKRNGCAGEGKTGLQNYDQRISGHLNHFRLSVFSLQAVFVFCMMRTLCEDCTAAEWDLKRKEEFLMRFFSPLRPAHRSEVNQRDLREDQEYILRQITKLALREQPDAVVIAGDIYDRAVPSGEAVECLIILHGTDRSTPGSRSHADCRKS